MEPPTSQGEEQDEESNHQEEETQSVRDQKAGKEKKNKKRGSNRGTVTLGGLKKIEKARKRKMKQKLRKKLGETMESFQKDGKAEKKKGPPPPTRSLLFVDNTANGELARRLTEAEKKLGEDTKYRVRIAESAGDALGVLLPSTNPWGPMDCGRKDCVPCGQEDERRLDCRRRNILYENVCQLRHQEDGKEKKDRKDERGVYIGESSRSMHERAKEHVADRVSMQEDSHMLKHWLCDHPDLLEPPKFKFRIIRSFQDPLTRQLAEAVRIERSGEGILNSKSEFNRCRIPRLKINLEEWGIRKEEEKEKKERVDEELEKEAEESLETRTPVKRKESKEAQV